MQHSGHAITNRREISDPQICCSVANGVMQDSKDILLGVSVVAQWLTIPTRNHEVAGLIPGLAQWVKDLVLL